MTTDFVKKLMHHIQEKLKAGNLKLVLNRLYTYEDFSRKLPTGIYNLKYVR